MVEQIQGLEVQTHVDRWQNLEGDQSYSNVDESPLFCNSCRGRCAVGHIAEIQEEIHIVLERLGKQRGLESEGKVNIAGHLFFEGIPKQDCCF